MEKLKVKLDELIGELSADKREIVIQRLALGGRSTYISEEFRLRFPIARY